MTEAAKVLELVVFGLKQGTSKEEFLATVDPVSAWVQAQPGFISRELTYVAEGDRWAEVLWWETMEDATAAAELAMTSESCAPMFGLIEMESTLMIHGELAMPAVYGASTPVEA